MFLNAVYAKLIQHPAGALTVQQTSPPPDAAVVPHGHAIPIQPHRPFSLRSKIMKRSAILVLILFSWLPALAWAQQQKAAKPLAGYAAVLVEPFTVENGQLTKDFPAGEEANLQLSTLARLQTSRLFDSVIDGSQKSSHQPQPYEPSAKGGLSTLILSVTIVSFNKGSSGTRMMTWPFPVGASKAKARFVFRDAADGQEVLNFEREAKFQAFASGGGASKEEQMAHIKGGLVDALLKEIQRNR